ncbi:MAG: GGDEF domain-containing protein [Erysipelotrichia bacterium]|nr:GGDEF domain-containing protein [Erysipelotrichia bacterium]
MFRSFIKKLNSAVFNEHPEEIQKRNLIGMSQLLLITVLVAAVMVISMCFLGLGISLGELIFLAVCYVICYLFYRYIVKTGRGNSTIVIYCMSALMLISVIFRDNITMPDRLTFFFQIILMAAPVYILDRPRNVVLFSAAMSGIYLIVMYLFKNPSLFTYEIECLVMALPASLGVTVFVLTMRIQDLENEVSLKLVSEHDALTSILNRGGGEGKIREYLSRGVCGAFFLMDVDNFKSINDVYGHSRGDEVLEQAAARIKAVFRTEDIVMRMGGDEFIVYAPSMVAADRVKFKISEVRQSISRMSLEGCPDVHITVSIGCIINKTSYTSYDEVFSKADNLLYEAKRNGKNTSAIRMLYNHGGENKMES